MAYSEENLPFSVATPARVKKFANAIERKAKTD